MEDVNADVPVSPQMKRKLSDREIEEVQPDQKTAKIDEEEEDGVTEVEAAAAEVQDLLARRKAAAKEVIEREYEEITMAPEGQHSDFMQEIQSRAEIVNKGAVQNEGTKEKLLSNLSRLDNPEAEEEASSLAVIRGTYTGVEDASVSAPADESSAAVERMHEVTGIPRGLKFDISVSAEDYEDAKANEVEVDINLDVVAASPRLNTDLQKARSALAYKGAMVQRRLPVQTVTSSKLVTAEDREFRRSMVLAREEEIAIAVQEEIVEEKHDPKPAVPAKPGMSTAEKVRQALTEKLSRPVKEEKKVSGQTQHTPNWALDRQKQILKPSPKPVNLDEQVEATREESGSKAEKVEDNEEGMFKPSLSKLAALEKRRERAGAGTEPTVLQFQLRKTPSGTREVSVEKADKPSSPPFRVPLKKTEPVVAQRGSATPDEDKQTFYQSKPHKTTTETTSTVEMRNDAKKESPTRKVELQKTVPEKPPETSLGQDRITVVSLKSTTRGKRSPSPVSPTRTDFTSGLKKRDAKPSPVPKVKPHFTKIQLRSSGHRQSQLERELAIGEEKQENKTEPEGKSMVVATNEELKEESKEEMKEESKEEMKEESKEEMNEEPKEELNKEPKEEMNEEPKDKMKEESKEEKREESKKPGKEKEKEQVVVPSKKGPPPPVKKKVPPPTLSRKPVAVSVPSDGVPGWKKALMERRKSGKFLPPRQVSKTEMPSDADKIPQWKRDLMIRRKRSEDKMKIGSSVSEPKVTTSQNPQWIRDAQKRQVQRLDSSVSVTQLSNRMSRSSISEDEDKVPSFIKEFEDRRRKKAAGGRGLEPEWKKQLLRKKSEQDITADGTV